MRWLYLVASGFATAFDLVMGIFIVWFLVRIWPYELRWHHYILAGLLGVAPDFDIIHRVLFVKKGEGLTDHHDSIIHRPVFGLSVVAGFGYLLGGIFWVLAATLPIFAHYLHDTRGLGGGGIAWLWPFSYKHYGFSSKGILVTESRDAVELWPDHNKWLEQKYLQPSFRSMLELISSALFLAVVVGNTLGWPWGVVELCVIWSLACLLWSIYGLMRACEEETEGMEAF